MSGIDFPLTAHTFQFGGFAFSQSLAKMFFDGPDGIGQGEMKKKKKKFDLTESILKLKAN